MKKVISFALAALTVITMASALFSGIYAAEALGVTHCVTFILYPQKTTNPKHYEMVYYQTGEQIQPPEREEEATYETDEFYYLFLGWDGFEGKTDKERSLKVIEYFDTKPGINYYEPYEAKPLPVMGEEDLVLHAVFRLLPKMFDVDKNKTYNVADVTFLLDILGSLGNVPDYDVTGDGSLTVRDVTAMLNFLAAVIL